MIHERNITLKTADAELLLERLARHLDPFADGLASMGKLEHGGGSRLDTIADRFRLTEFERRLLAWTCAVEIDSELSEVTRALSGADSRPSMLLAMAVLPEPHWSATARLGTLRRWSFLSPAPGLPALSAPVAVAECVLDYLVGLPFGDPKLQGWLHPVAAHVPTGEHRRLAETLASEFESSTTGQFQVHLRGNTRATEAVAALALELAGFSASKLFVADLPGAGQDLADLGMMWSRQAVLGRTGLLLQLPDDLSPTVDGAVSRFLDLIWGPVFLLGESRSATRLGGVAICDVGPLSRGERAELFRVALGDVAKNLNGQIEKASGQLILDSADITAIANEFRLEGPSRSTSLWDVGRKHARPELGPLAVRIESNAGWDDLVLPAAQVRTLHEIGHHVRHRLKVYEEWGFGEMNKRGLGISALFHGPSGTGKTLAAEVLANSLELDLYRIDLSGVVSKYIGETEKNLSRIFDAAESAPVILLFDEADALFGKRSEVRDSHDRYANLEVSYLLQRVEAFSGIAILTTNMKNALDQAFLRRIRFVVSFPFPDQQQRAEIWKRVFPRRVPVVDLDVARLSKMNVAGGSIRNIAINGAFRAAAEGGQVAMRHLHQAARAEYEKLEKPLSETEFGGWGG